MSLPVLVLRPEPGNAATCAALAASGLDAIAAPLFALEPCAWDAPAPDQFDRLLLTSANAVRHGGGAITHYAGLPCACVGAATARAAREIGLSVDAVGDHDGAAILAAHSEPGLRWLWLTGEPHSPLRPANGQTLTTMILYRSVALPVAAETLSRPAIAMLYSQAAARQLARLAPARDRLHLVAISAAVGDAAGAGWASLTIAAQPQDAAMVALAQRLCQNGPEAREQR